MTQARKYPRRHPAKSANAQANAHGGLRHVFQAKVVIWSMCCQILCRGILHLQSRSGGLLTDITQFGRPRAFAGLRMDKGRATGGDLGIIRPHVRS